MSEAQGKMRIAEIFYSLQGEGLYQGVPSVFVRVFGCNFKCQGFGMPRGQLSNEYQKIDPEATKLAEGKRELEYQHYNDLPLVHTGCDSYASWDPRFKHLSPWMTIDEIVDKIESVLPNGKFDDNTHLILTGGEPLLPGWQREWPALINAIYDAGMVENDLLDLTFETNGSQIMSNDLKNELIDHGCIPTMSVSSKLPSSGEPWDKAINPVAVRSYFPFDAYFKWVVSNPEDVADVRNAIAAYAKHGILIPVYLMPAGGTTVGYEANKKWVAELAMKNGWRYSQRLQVDLWKNAWGT